MGREESHLAVQLQLVSSRWQEILRCYSQVWAEDLWSVSGRQQGHLHQTSHGCFADPERTTDSVSASCQSSRRRYRVTAEPAAATAHRVTSHSSQQLHNPVSSEAAGRDSFKLQLVKKKKKENSLLKTGANFIKASFISL